MRIFKGLILIIFISFSIETIFADDFIIDDSSSGLQPQPQPPHFTPSSFYEGPDFIGSVPTPDSVGKDRLSCDFIMYNNGGVETRISAGFLNVIAIGISEDIDYLIGCSNINVNIPGANLKITPIRNLGGFSFSLGYDSFAYGENGTYHPSDGSAPSTIYGAYLVTGQNYTFLGNSTVWSAGFRYPVLPVAFDNITNSSLFFGTYLPFTENFSIGITLENIYFNAASTDRILPSVIFNFSPLPSLKLSLALQYQFYSSSINRIFSIDYTAAF